MDIRIGSRWCSARVSEMGIYGLMGLGWLGLNSVLGKVGIFLFLKSQVGFRQCGMGIGWGWGVRLRVL